MTTTPTTNPLFLLGVEPDFDTGYAALLDFTTNKYAYVHDCGYIVYSQTAPSGCLECRSNLRQAMSNHGTWHQLFIRHQDEGSGS
ncbi:hypothetical protein GCM10009630_73110 [Kribbella jejuensis]|uniref:Uncharacterized protein n=2 Tax=Actinomycetes TaxID=1760 RepID=A0A542EWM0_9ACTN|nr:hypothetical protein [Kribbella jejuensis]TQJ19717.1 hypothetical protein FB475_3891 [Kribbella jejuensis]